MYESSASWLPVMSLAIAVIAVLIGIYNLFAQLRACIVVSLIKRNGTFFLLIKNSGPGAATVRNVRARNADGSPTDFKHLEGRKVFPFDLGSGASYELTIEDSKEASYSNVEVEWKDFWCRGPRRIPISQFVRIVQ